MTRVRAPHYRLLLYAGESGQLDLAQARSSMGISPATLRKYVSLLAKEGLVEKRDGSVYLTQLGFKLLKTLKALKEGSKAPAYVLTSPDTGTPVPLTFTSYTQLYAILAYGFVEDRVVEYHLKKYMEGWLKSLGDEYLLDLVKTGRVKSARDLREYLEKILRAADLLG